MCHVLLSSLSINKCATFIRTIIETPFTLKIFIIATYIIPVLTVFHISLLYAYALHGWAHNNTTEWSKGAVTTDIEIPTVIPSVPHSHDPDTGSVAASRLKSTMKNISGTSWSTPTQILVDTTATGTTEIRAALGKPELVKRTLRRDLTKHLPQIHNHITTCSLTINGLRPTYFFYLWQWHTFTQPFHCVCD